MKTKITEKVAAKVLDVVDQGLCFGLGEPEPGMMCVEAAVCYALGEEHNDEPSCVDPELRDFKINLNDQSWQSRQSRARGLRQIAIAQLGTSGRFDFAEFLRRLRHKLLAKRMCENLLWDSDLCKPLVEQLKAAKSVSEFEEFFEEWADFSPMVEKHWHIWCTDFGLSSFTSDYLRYLGSVTTEKDLPRVADAATQILVEMKTPGSKYLYLTETKRPKKVLARSDR